MKIIIDVEYLNREQQDILVHEIQTTLKMLGKKGTIQTGLM